MKITRKQIDRALRNTEDKDKIVEISRLATYFTEEPLEGLVPMFYFTLSYEEDLKYHNRLKELINEIL